MRGEAARFAIQDFLSRYDQCATPDPNKSRISIPRGERLAKKINTTAKAMLVPQFILPFL